MARALHEWGDYRDTVTTYLEMITLVPDELRVYLSIGQSYESLGRPADAMAAYTRYLGMEPGADNVDGIRGRIEELVRVIGSDSARSTAP